MIMQHQPWDKKIFKQKKGYYKVLQIAEYRLWLTSEIWANTIYLFVLTLWFYWNIIFIYQLFTFKRYIYRSLKNSSGITVSAQINSLFNSQQYVLCPDILHASPHHTYTLFFLFISFLVFHYMFCLSFEILPRISQKFISEKDTSIFKKIYPAFSLYYNYLPTWSRHKQKSWV